MLNLKKTAVAVLALGSSAVFAGSMGPVCAPGNVTVPCASTAWDFGAQALYLKPSYSGLGYIGSTYTTNAADTSVTSEQYNRTPYNWGWGFKIEGSYHFNTGNDLNLNWYHLDHTSNKNFSWVTGSFAGHSNIDTTVPATTLSASAQTRWDAVNLEFGQHAHFGEWKNIRFHGGVQYAYIKDSLDADFNGMVVPAQLGAIDNSLKFSGFGPRIGADYWYNWGNGFAMYANGASALLVGSQSFDTTHVITTGDVPPVVTSLTKSGSMTAIVPELEAKLGVTYTYAMAQGDLSLDLGWMWVNYFNALQADGGFPGGSGGPTEGTYTQSNFAVQGPFIGLKWVGNVA